MASATSWGVPARHRGVSWQKAALSWGDSRWFMAVSISPGATQFTRTPLGPTSRAAALVSPMSPALAAEYAASQEAPDTPHMLDTFTTAEGVAIAAKNGMKERTFKKFLSDRRGVFFTRDNHGIYSKI